MTTAIACERLVSKEMAEREAGGEAGKARTLRRLRGELERYQSGRSRRAGWTRRFVSTSVPQLDTFLPHGGLPCGAITEILAAGPGVGAASLAVRIAGEVLEVGGNPTQSPLVKGGGCRGVSPITEGGGFMVVVDTLGDLYPPALVSHGIPLDRVLVVRPGNEREAFWAAEQSLRCPAVGVVMAGLSRITPRQSRQLQLAAESSGCTGLILRPARHAVKSFAAARVLIEGAASQGGSAPSCDAHRARITLVKAREGMPAGPFIVDLHHETDAGVVSSLPVHRPAVQRGS